MVKREGEPQPKRHRSSSGDRAQIGDATRTKPDDSSTSGVEEFAYRSVLNDIDFAAFREGRHALLQRPSFGTVTDCGIAVKSCDSYACSSLPMTLCLSWNVSLDEARWIQARCGMAAIAAEDLRQLRWEEERRLGGGGSLASREPSATPDSQGVVDWVKKKLGPALAAPLAAESGASTSLNEPPLGHRPDSVGPDGSIGTAAAPHWANPVGDKPFRASGPIRITSALARLNDTATVSTGHSVLDRLLHGGLQCGFITEIVGGPCAGKSSFVAQLVASAVLDGALEDRSGQRADNASGSCPTRRHQGVKRAVVINVGDNLLPTRLHHAVSSYPISTGSRLGGVVPSSDSSRRQQVTGGTVVEADEWSEQVRQCALARVQYSNIRTVEQLVSLLPRIAAHILTTGRGSTIVVIDSFATLIHNCLSSDPSCTIRRHQEIGNLMRRLKAFAEEYTAAVVITNYSSSYRTRRFRSERASTTAPVDDADVAEPVHDFLPDHSDHLRSDVPLELGAGAQQNDREACGAFGNSFFHAVNNRFALETLLIGGYPRFLLRIVKSPVCPQLVFDVLLRELPTATSSSWISLSIADEATQAVALGEARTVPVNHHYVGVVAHLVPPVWPSAH